MYLSPDDYRAAAAERVAAARCEYLAGRYADSIYLSGLATEAILRAYRTRTDPEFDSRHDLVQLLKASNLERFVPAKRGKEIAAKLAEVWIRWKNDYRYASSDRLRSAFRKRGLWVGVTGDILKANALIVLNSALELVGIGESRWKVLLRNK